MSVDDAATAAAPSVENAHEVKSDRSENTDTMNEFAVMKGTDDTANYAKEDEGPTLTLPQSLLSEGMDPVDCGAMPREMTEEERKEAAMRTIAQLQEWAAKSNNSNQTTPGTSGVPQTGYGARQGAQVNGGQNDSQVRLAMLLQQQQQREAQQIFQQQQQARQRSEMLQRIIQDYLQGKQLSVYELQMLQQYIQQQQQQQQRTAARPSYVMPTTQTPSYIGGNIPDYASAYAAREQIYPMGAPGTVPDASRVYQERIAAAAAAGQAQARLNLMQREAMMKMQKPVYQNPTVSLEDQLLAMARSGSQTPDVAARIGAQQYLNGATSQGISNGYRMPQYQAAYGDGMRQQQQPSTYYQNGQAGMPANDHMVRSANSAQNLQDIGKTLAQLGISVEGAVNAGLLGGLSASDVRVVAESHRLACERVSLPNNGNGLNKAAVFAGGMKSPSFGNFSAPTPSSPVGSLGNVSSTSLPINVQQAAISPTSKSTSIAEEEQEQALLDQIVSDDNQNAVKRNDVDEEWLKSKVDSSASTFDASRYGFFGPHDCTRLSDELEQYADDQTRTQEDDKLSDYLAGLKLGTGFM